ncbi:MAG: helix-hairpin-helix domain-containing protein [Actinomycetota bacterium]
MTSPSVSPNPLGEPSAGSILGYAGHHTEEAATATDAAQQRFFKDSELELSQSLWWRSRDCKPFPEEANGGPAPRNGHGFDAELHRIRRRQLTRPRNGPARMLNLNEATIENLRAAGLTRTQAHRIVARRARRDGFTSMNELDDLPGFPAQLLSSFKQRVTL